MQSFFYKQENLLLFNGWNVSIFESRLAFSFIRLNGVDYFLLR